MIFWQFTTDFTNLDATSIFYFNDLSCQKWLSVFRRFFYWLHNVTVNRRELNCPFTQPQILDRPKSNWTQIMPRVLASALNRLLCNNLFFYLNDKINTDLIFPIKKMDQLTKQLQGEKPKKRFIIFSFYQSSLMPKAGKI